MLTSHKRKLAVAIDVADDAISAEDECGRLFEHLDISARARFPTEVERTGKTQDGVSRRLRLGSRRA